MPGLDDSDFVMILRISGASPVEIALQTAARLADNLDKANEWRAIVALAPAGEAREAARLTHERSIQRREAAAARLRMADPWAFWPYLADDELHHAAAYLRYGYWQGLFGEGTDRLAFARRQWRGEGIGRSVEALGLPVLRERLAIWSMANFWALVARDSCGGRVPPALAELVDILSEDWWNANLRGIAWGGGIGKPESAQERRLRSFRDAGHPWSLACAHVYSDPRLAAMIAAGLERREARSGRLPPRSPEPAGRSPPLA